ncbi:MAG: hypothetical protein JXN60_03255, partial [Lentisphaerae bacterium]|nr:hypothetical protein [Lentisphaerota bacterium]
MKTEHFSPKRAARLILEQFIEIEKAWKQEHLRKRLLRAFRQFLSTLAHTNGYQPAEQIRAEIRENMDLQSLWALLVPIEREWSKERVTDDDFLLSSSDDPIGARSSVMPVFVVLDNIRSVFNVGGIFRTSECAGVNTI